MKNFQRKILSVALGALFGAIAAYAYIELTSIKINVFFTNDVHGRVFAKDGMGGAAALKNFLNKQNTNYLLLDAGDFFQGTPEGDLTDGEANIKIMNALGYNAATAGNHEFDKGKEQLIKLSQMANFPLLGANVIDATTNSTVDWLKPYHIIESNGIRIGILGLVTSAMPHISMPEVRKGILFEDEVKIANQYLPELKEKSDIIIALTHIGIAKNNEFNDDVYLATSTNHIDFIIGGHTHTLLKKKITANGTVILQAGSYGTHIGKLVLKVRKNKLIGHSYKLIPMSIKKFGEDEVFKNTVIEMTAGISEKMETIIGKSQEEYSNSLGEEYKFNGELPLGNWQTDIFRKMTDSDIAFQNIGGIRAQIPKGNVTVRNIYELSPFGNTIYTMTLTGAQIKDILEKSVSGRFGMLQISGIKFKYDSNRKEGDKVTEIIIGNTSLDLTKHYKIATNSFVAKGGDGFDTFLYGKDVRDTGIIDRDMLIEYLKNNAEIKAQIEKRIVNITK